MKKSFINGFIAAGASFIVLFGMYAFTTNSNQETKINTIAGDQFKVVTIVESIVPMGLGRSRIIENTTDLNVEEFTTSRIDGKKSDQSNIKRKDVKVDAFNESKLLNFYSGVGINFQNVASNDALIASKINGMYAQGYTLQFIASGVESNAGKDDGKGIFITRLIFKKM